MTTISKSGEKESTNQTTNHTILGTTVSFWPRQQRLAGATIAGFAILGLLLTATACSTQSPEPALAGVSSPASTSPTPAATAAIAPTAAASPARAKKTPKRRPADVTYTDANSGVSFLYPRKFALSTGDKAEPQLGMGDVPMNFGQPGGVALATVALPSGSYPGTDFASAFFNVNVNRGISEQECAHFAFVDTRNADEEAVDAEKVKIGATDMEMTSNFSGNAIKQAETEYYHSYENGACYEYVLGLGTEGFATEGGIEHVNRDEVFAKLEKILATVKINPVEPEHVADASATNMVGGK